MSRSFSSSTRSRFFSNPQREYTSLEWTLEGESGWLRYFAVARMGVLSFITVGSAFLSIERGAEYLLLLYTFGFVTNYWYLHTLHAKQQVGSLADMGASRRRFCRSRTHSSPNRWADKFFYLHFRRCRSGSRCPPGFETRIRHRDPGISIHA